MERHLDGSGLTAESRGGCKTTPRKMSGSPPRICSVQANLGARDQLEAQAVTRSKLDLNANERRVWERRSSRKTPGKAGAVYPSRVLEGRSDHGTLRVSRAQSVAGEKSSAPNKERDPGQKRSKSGVPVKEESHTETLERNNGLPEQRGKTQGKKVGDPTRKVRIEPQGRKAKKRDRRRPIP